MVALEAQVDGAALGDQQGVGQGFGHLGKQAGHFFGAAQVIGIIRHAHALGVGQQTAGLDRQQDVLQAGIVFVDVVNIVGGHKTGIVAVTQVEQHLVDVIQLGNIVLLKLQVEAVWAKDLIVPVELPPGGRDVLLLDQARDLSRHAARGADQPFRVLGQKLVVNARVIVKAIQLGSAGQAQQVLIAGLILGQQQQVAGLFIFLGVALFHRAGGQVGLDADDRLDACRGGGVVKLEHPEHGAVVGQAQGGHAHLLGALDQLLDVAEPIQERIFRVTV